MGFVGAPVPPSRGPWGRRPGFPVQDSASFRASLAASLQSPALFAASGVAAFRSLVHSQRLGLHATQAATPSGQPSAGSGNGGDLSRDPSGRGYLWQGSAPVMAAAAVTNAKEAFFEANKSIALACREEEATVDQYLVEAERVMRVGFPDRKRLTYLGDDRWRAQLTPVKFFHVTATPICEMRSWHENGILRVSSDQVYLETEGIPGQDSKTDLHLRLEGRLYATRGHQTKPREPDCKLEGSVDMGLSLELPAPFTMMPESAVTGVGNAVMNGILVRMQRAMMRGLIRDYKQWAREQAASKSSQDGMPKDVEPLRPEITLASASASERRQK